MNNIKLSTDTYNTFLTIYIDLHQEILEDIEHCKKELDALLHSEGGFHADLISTSLNEMMEIWDTVYTSTLKTEFDQTEKVICDYLATMQAADEA